MLKMNKNLFLAMLALGVMFVLAAPEAMAQSRCRTRGGSSREVYDNGNYRDSDRYRDTRDRDYRDADYGYRDSRDHNYRNAQYRDRSSRDSNRDYDNRDYRYRNREDTTENAVKRTAIGAGIGTLGGAIIGGKKGALIGAGVGAAGGYIYHRNKAKNDRYRY